MFYFKRDSHVLNKISEKYGISIDKLMREFDIRVRILMQMYKKKVFGFEKVQSIIHEYYKNPRGVMKKLGLVA